MEVLQALLKFKLARGNVSNYHSNNCSGFFYIPTISLCYTCDVDACNIRVNKRIDSILSIFRKKACVCEIKTSSGTFYESIHKIFNLSIIQATINIT